MKMPFGRTSRAFTLVEMLVVIAIIAVLAGLLLPVLARVKEKGKVVKAQTEVKNIAGAIAQYQALYGVYPAPQADTKLGADQTYYENNSNVVMILMDVDLPGGVNEGHARNPQKHVFLTAKMVNSTDEPGIGPDFVFRDPWRQPYVITLDLDYDSKCFDKRFLKQTAPTPVAVWSYGKERTEKSAIKSW